MGSGASDVQGDDMADVLCGAFYLVFVARLHLLFGYIEKKSFILTKIKSAGAGRWLFLKLNICKGFAGTEVLAASAFPWKRARCLL